MVELVRFVGSGAPQWLWADASEVVLAGSNVAPTFTSPANTPDPREMSLAEKALPTQGEFEPGPMTHVDAER
jgi:hypothetical protein